MIAVTGAAGFVGQALCDALVARGQRVRRLSRRPDATRGDARFALGEDVRPEALAGVETLVHAAHDFRPAREAELRHVNVDGSRRLFDAARAAGVRRLLFVSSIASYAGSQSAYGRVKFTLEQDAAAWGGSSIRPGTVFAATPGGLFGSLLRVVRVAPALPDFGPRARIRVVHLADLLAVIEAWLARPGESPALLRASHPDAVTLRDVLATLAASAGRTARFVPVPAAPALAALRAAEALGLTLPFRSDSLVSMLHGDPDPGLAPEVLGVRLRPLTVETLRQ